MSSETESIDSISLRRFLVDDWSVYKSIRLEALELESHNFGGRYHEEVKRSDEVWMDNLRQENYWAFWGLYDRETCIGLTGAVQAKDDPTMVNLIASYIRKSYRGKGLSALYYQVRIDWARTKGYKTMHVDHRGDNLVSKAANQKFGFQFVETAMVPWPDGTMDIRVGYKLTL